MPVASLTERYLEILDGSTGREVENLFRDESQADIKQAAITQFIKDLERLFIVPTRVSLSDVAAYVQLIEREKNTKIGVIGIDYMGLMDGPGVSEYEIISRLSTGLKSTAKLLNIPAIVLAQVNRKGGGGTNEISLDMGRGSGAIEEAADFVEQTGVDALAVAIGTSHGFYKKEPRLDLERLSSIREATNAALVLHGGSGVPHTTLTKAIERGICKINLATEIKNIFMKTLKAKLKDETEIDLRKVFPVAINAVTTLVTEKLNVVNSQ